MNKLITYLNLISDFKRRYGLIKTFFFIILILLISIFSLFVFFQALLPFTYIAI